ncbi:MAG: U32 family peptidase [Gammaproteobacteria bacterium]|nr:U32 family peptidase [Gammaproteobacteria bacterium]
MRLALGPVPYYWPSEALLEFYEAAARWPVHTVYLGEVVCPKRRHLRFAEWLELARRLASAGKEVVLSTATILEADADWRAIERICANGEFLVEANDAAALYALRGQPFVAGPGMNVYNGQTLAFLAGLGLRRWVMPFELSGATLADFQASRPAGVETEVFAFGRLPLAQSARCFTARAHGLPKDDCQLKCLEHPDGLALRTQDDSPFLVLNGVQVQSAQIYQLLGQVPELERLGVESLRIAPVHRHTEAAVAAFAAVLAGEETPEAGVARLLPLAPLGLADGYWRGEPGLRSQSSKARPTSA